MGAPEPAASGRPWTERRVLSYAHQGGAWEAPSSTLYAIGRALDLGATGIELDVHATADGELVVSHDATVDRTTGASGAIAALTLAQVQALDNAYWWAPGADVTPGLAADAYPFRGRAPDDPDFRVATLAEVLALMAAHPGVALNLDIKATTPTVTPYEARLADQLRAGARIEDVIVASFLDDALDAFRACAPEVATSAGMLATAEFWRAAHAGTELPATPYVALQVPAEHSGLVVVDDTLVAAAHGAGVAVHVWTINDEAEMARLVDLGVDGVISDRPTALLATLAGRGAPAAP